MSGKVRLYDFRTGAQVAVVGLDESSSPVVLEGTCGRSMLEVVAKEYPNGPEYTPAEDGERWLQVWAAGFNGHTVAVYEPE